MSFRAFVVAGFAALSAGMCGVEANEGPVIVFRMSATASSRTDADDALATALAVASLSAEDRGKLIEQVDYATARLEARLSPLADDLGDESVDPVVELKRAIAPRVPALTAARAIARSTWTSGDVTVRIAPSCRHAEVASDETCAPLWDAQDRRPAVMRARFEAWPVAYAGVLDLGTPPDAARCADALRVRTTLPHSSVGLVIVNQAPTDTDVAERERLRAAAQRLGRALATNHAPHDRDLATFTQEPKGRTMPRVSVIAKDFDESSEVLGHTRVPIASLEPFDGAAEDGLPDVIS